MIKKALFLKIASAAVIAAALTGCANEEEKKAVHKQWAFNQNKKFISIYKNQTDYIIGYTNSKDSFEKQEFEGIDKIIEFLNYDSTKEMISSLSDEEKMSHIQLQKNLKLIKEAEKAYAKTNAELTIEYNEAKRSGDEILETEISKENSRISNYISAQNLLCAKNIKGTSHENLKISVSNFYFETNKPVPGRFPSKSHLPIFINNNIESGLPPLAKGKSIALNANFPKIPIGNRDAIENSQKYTSMPYSFACVRNPSFPQIKNDCTVVIELKIENISENKISEIKLTEELENNFRTNDSGVVIKDFKTSFNWTLTDDVPNKYDLPAQTLREKINPGEAKAIVIKFTFIPVPHINFLELKFNEKAFGTPIKFILNKEILDHSLDIFNGHNYTLKP